MAYTFEPGHSYYNLTATQFAELQSLLQEFELDYDLASDFSVADDGQYYCDVSTGLVDSDERSFLEDMGLLQVLEYKKSTQSTIWVH